MSKIKPGIYRHYKGNLYKVIYEAKHSETDEEMVVYQCQYGNFDIWVRPKALFIDTVTSESERKPRFAFVSDQ